MVCRNRSFSGFNALPLCPTRKRFEAGSVAHFILLYDFNSFCGRFKWLYKVNTLFLSWRRAAHTIKNIAKKNCWLNVGIFLTIEQELLTGTVLFQLVLACNERKNFFDAFFFMIRRLQSQRKDLLASRMTFENVPAWLMLREELSGPRRSVHDLGYALTESVRGLDGWALLLDGPVSWICENTWIPSEPSKWFESVSPWIFPKTSINSFYISNKIRYIINQ